MVAPGVGKVNLFRTHIGPADHIVERYGRVGLHLVQKVARVQRHIATARRLGWKEKQLNMIKVAIEFDLRVVGKIWCCIIENPFGKINAFPFVQLFFSVGVLFDFWFPKIFVSTDGMLPDFFGNGYSDQGWGFGERQ